MDYHLNSNQNWLASSDESCNPQEQVSLAKFSLLEMLKEKRLDLMESSQIRLMEQAVRIAVKISNKQLMIRELNVSIAEKKQCLGEADEL